MSPTEGVADRNVPARTAKGLLISSTEAASLVGSSSGKNTSLSCVGRQWIWFSFARSGPGGFQQRQEGSTRRRPYRISAALRLLLREMLRAMPSGGSTPSADHERSRSRVQPVSFPGVVQVKSMGVLARNTGPVRGLADLDAGASVARGIVRGRSPSSVPSRHWFLWCLFRDTMPVIAIELRTIRPPCHYVRANPIQYRGFASRFGQPFDARQYGVFDHARCFGIDSDWRSKRDCAGPLGAGRGTDPCRTRAGRSLREAPCGFDSASSLTRMCPPSVPAQGSQYVVRLRVKYLALPTGFEPVCSALRGLRPRVLM